MNGLEEPSIAKRLRGTPERIELENYRRSVRQVEELEEVPEETQAEHNLSSVLDKGTEEDAASSSSESEMEEEEEEDEEDQLPTSDLGGVPWKEAVRIHALLKGRSEEELEASKNFEPEEEEEEEEYEDDEEEYDEEEEESSEAGNKRLQQIITAADPLAIQADVHWTHIREREEEERMLPPSESSTSRDQHWSDDIPSDAETEHRLQSQTKVKADLELRVSENEEEKPSDTPKQEERGGQAPTCLHYHQEKPKAEGPEEQKTVHSPIRSQPVALPEARSPTSPTSSLQPESLLAPPTPPTPPSTQLPICSQPQPSSDASIPSPTKSPIRFQPVPAKTSTPLTPLPVKSQGDPKDRLSGPLAVEEALKRSDLVEEFWMKSAEIRRSLGLTPVDRNKGEEVRKSFVESVDEIPFADDVEDTYDDKTEDSSLQEKFFTPPSCWSRSEKLPAKENGRLPPLEQEVQPQKRALPLVSAEAKELAEERMRAREKSVKSQALRDAMAKQLSRMQAMEMVSSRSRPAPSPGKEPGLEATKHPSLRGSQEPTLKHEATSEEILSPPSDSGGPDGSVTSSEGSSGKSKKRSSLFSPRRNKKEKKSKGEGGRPPEKPSLSLPEDVAAKPKSLWKSVFSGYKKDKKKKSDEKSCSSTPSSGATVDSGQRRASPIVRAELHLRRQLSFSEDSDLSSDDILERSSQKSKREPRTYTEEELSAKLTRRVQKAARRQAKQEELKRLHRAQIIQRQLEQVEEKQRQLEERGVAVEKALRGEAGMGKKDDPKLMQEWFKLVQEKNAMVRYESELMIFARELELEDRQSRLQQELRERMAVEDHLKTEEELSEEKKILNEMLEVVEQRDSLVALLEEQRLREKEEDKDLEAAMLCKGFSLDWS
ncbi:rCG30240 [Rattus norvegicus]|uniref:RCG30240 n=1 Tax=Rattus norvegicus TaxID=10116 RepID=A6ILB5_RAT|nr:rCG30240 [Rattus norvegicus]